MTQTRTFGRYETTLLLDGLFEGSNDYLVHRGGPEARARALTGWREEKLVLDVNCFLLTGGDGATLVDFGAGDAMGPKLGRAREALRRAGVAPGEVARVLLTHLHSDHALGLLAGEDAYFPNAEIQAPERDLAFFTDEAARAATPEARQGGFRVAARVLAAYGGRVRAFPAGAVRPDIEAVPLPGHTPGQTGYLIGGALLLWGDALHVGALQSADPDLNIVFDMDPDIAAATRRATLEAAAREGWTVAGGHIHGFNRIERKGEGFGLVEV